MSFDEERFREADCHNHHCLDGMGHPDVGTSTGIGYTIVWQGKRYGGASFLDVLRAVKSRWEFLQSIRHPFSFSSPELAQAIVKIDEILSLFDDSDEES